MSNSLRPDGLQHARPLCPSPTPRAYSNSCPSHRWCHPAISSSVVPFSSHLQSFPASGSFPISWFFTSGGQTTGVSASASILPMNIQHSFPLGLTGGRFMLMYGKTNTISWSKNNFKKWRHRCREQMYRYQGGKTGVGWIGRLGLIFTHYWYLV